MTGNAINAKTPGIFCWDSATGNTFNRSITGGSSVTITNPNGITGNIDISVSGAPLPGVLDILGSGGVLVSPSLDIPWGSTVVISGLFSYSYGATQSDPGTPFNQVSFPHSFGYFWAPTTNSTNYIALRYESGSTPFAAVGDILVLLSTGLEPLRSFSGKFYAYVYDLSSFFPPAWSYFQYGTKKLAAPVDSFYASNTYALFKKASAIQGDQPMGNVFFICILPNVWSILDMQDFNISYSP